jgi:butyryl-CoA dehydrogenase
MGLPVAASASFPRGGAFLIEDALPQDVFALEDLSEEQTQIAQATAAFAERSVLPAVEEIEKKNFDVTRTLMRQAGDLGLLGIDVPEEFGGLDLDKVTSALVADHVAVCGSFSVSFSAHVCIGTLPLVWYGTRAQKERYLGKLASGEWISAYALSESSSGSDAMNIRAHARLSENGRSYILNGEKMWTSNAGIANLFTIFAKIDGEHFSAFLVEAGTAGFTIGKEEHKMGIRGSSTCPLILSDCVVPVDNLLGEAGKGHQIAFNVLNVGRYKLGAATLGGARYAFRNGLRYGKERIAFGKSITSFGLIQEKIAECAASIFAGEALVYRVVGAIDHALSILDKNAADFGRQVQKAIEEYAIECSVVKVWCSEMLERVVDHMLQVHGGYGYTEDFPIERGYRDSRINKIFEGTNEINRLIISGWVMKRAMQGRLALLPAIQKVMDEILSGPKQSDASAGSLAEQRALLSSGKKLCLFAAGCANQRYPVDLVGQQEIMGALADMLIEVLVMESAILRAEKMREKNLSAIRLARYYAARSFQTIAGKAESVIAAVSEGDNRRTQMTIFRRLVKHDPINLVTLGREIAAQMIEAGRYSV